ncbi:IS110 family transposase [Rhodanobacter caeni]|uniref:IS110 family transposase n=2 Tax=Rhodanobacter caeni TaxID=657654 RepID=A0ABP3E3X8_9GAMM
MVVGVDVAKATFDVAVGLAKAGKFQTRAKVANREEGFKELMIWLDKHAPEAAVCMEATGIYHEALASFLVQQGKTVYVANPAQVKYFGKSQLTRTKTDRTDAKLIAQFATSQQAGPKPMSPWTPPTPGQRILRAQVERLDDLKGMERMEANRLDVANDAVRDSVETSLKTLRQQIKALERRIDKHIDQDPGLRHDATLIASIPGIAKTTSASLLAALGDLRRFDAPGKLVAFAGLNPALRESGTLKGQVRISKTGAPGLRAKLYMPAVSAKNHNPIVRAFCERLLARGKLPIVTVCAAMRKLLHLAWGVIHTDTPFDANHARHHSDSTSHASGHCALA